ncbi:porin family protein [Alkalilimnicola ehrlichii]|nr:porin family protein [Alkalilimnicola ehrlichii]
MNPPSLKRALACGLLMLMGSSPVVAGVHLGVGVAPNAKGREMDGMHFEDTTYLTVWMGRLRPHALGWYVGGGVSPQLVDSSSPLDLHYNYNIVNGGTTFGLSNALAAYAGLGYSVENGEFRVHGEQRRTNASRDAINVNAGIVYRVTPSWGGKIGFDSAADAISIGIMRRM